MTILEIKEWHMVKPEQTTLALEKGKIIYLPTQGFHLSDEESCLLDVKLLAPKQKNISYHHLSKSLSHLNQAYHAEKALTVHMMSRFADYANQLITALFPDYSKHLIWGRTSYRPAEIVGRHSSVLKDDTRLHVDAFKATPVHGKRILRVFANINPHNMPRVWHIGESFSDVLTRFKPDIPRYSNLIASIQSLLKLTKTKRSLYDHMMLSLHDQMKRDDQYQAEVKKTVFDFPAGSTWIVFTDQVSHAALAGQYLLEQSFYLPIEAQVYPEYAPFIQLMA